MANKLEIEAPTAQPVPGFPNYNVLPTGEVWNKKKGKYVTKRDINGYVAVVISANGKAEQIYMQKLVALTFVPNPDPTRYDRVRHIDGDRKNNNYTNLAWTNQSEACKMGKTGEKEDRPARKVREKRVRVKTHA